MENLTATYLLRDVRVPTCINIEGFTLKPAPENPNNTYLRFHFTHHPKKDLHFQSQKEIHLFSLVLSRLYKLGNPEFETITDKSGVRVRAGARSMRNLLQLKQKDFDKIEKAYKKVKSMTDEDRQIFDFVARWVQKASDSRDAYDKFIFYWMWKW